MALLRVDNLCVIRKVGGLFSNSEAISAVHAVKDVSLKVEEGGVTGIAGETCCGKSSLALAILKVLKPRSGEIHFSGRPIHKLGEWRFQKVRADMQMLYSQPRDAFHPKWTANRLFREAFDLHQPKKSSKEREKYFHYLLRVVGLPLTCASKYPRELSLFDQQRLAIARILVIHPRLLICDDPTRYLDTVSQARLLDLLKDIHQHWQVSMLFLARDYSVIDHMSDYIHVMNDGRILEHGTPHDLYHSPNHEYTRQLLALSGAL